MSFPLDSNSYFVITYSTPKEVELTRENLSLGLLSHFSLSRKETEMFLIVDETNGKSISGLDIEFVKILTETKLIFWIKSEDLQNALEWFQGEDNV
jgi:hypothetical protein